MHKSRENICIGIIFFFFFFFFLTPNSIFLYISFPGRQTTKARDFNSFHHEANIISYSIIYSLFIIDWRKLVNINRKV